MTPTEQIDPSPPPSTESPGGDAPPGAASSAFERATVGALLEEILPLIGVVVQAGPPVVFAMGPWLLFVLVLTGPFALLLTLAIVALVTAALVIAPLVIAAATYRLSRHLLVALLRGAPPRVLVRQFRVRLEGRDRPSAAPRFLRRRDVRHASGAENFAPVRNHAP